MKLFFLVLFAFGIAGCSTSKKDWCQSTDWYELGRRDGAQGKAKNEFNQHHNYCDTNDKTVDFKLYINGYNAGLADYCLPENAFELGRTGQHYPNVCPKEIEQDFLRKYRRGQRVYNLEKSSQRTSKGNAA